MKIDGVVISCYVLDVYFTRVCVASIRLWYPELPIWLLKDRQYGDFDTREIESNWNVQVYPSRQRNLGWGFGKLEVLCEPPTRRLLLLDSDIVFAGRVIERLESYDEDIIVESFDETAIEQEFFSLDALRKVDPSFNFPGYGFNTGQFVTTTGKITKDDFAGLVDWQTRAVMRPDVFKMGEQGVLNYVAQRKAEQGALTIRREAFMVRPGKGSRAKHIHVEDLNREGRHQELIHWAGLRWGKTLAEMPRSDILLHFEKLYYQRIKFGDWLKEWRLARFRIDRRFITPAKILAKTHLAKLKRPQTHRPGERV
jgi:hypothetical protein